ncbi:MAG: ATP-binding protein [Pseudomonadota bacterium]
MTKAPSSQKSISQNDTVSLQRQVDRYREIFHTYPFDIIVVDRSGRITDFNITPHANGINRSAGRKPAIGDRMYTADYAGGHSVDMRSELMECIENGTPRAFDRLPYHSKYLSVYIAPFSDGAVITAMDITREIHAEEERKKFEAQLMLSQKLEAVGTLAGGIAHDFNNILWIISGNAELAKSDIPDGNPIRKHLEKIEGACLRAKDLVMQILNYSRQTTQEKRPLIINSLIKESLKLLRASLPTTIDIQQHITTEPLTIMADISLITQVLMNLCTNAAHAMRKDGGVLDIGLTDLTLDEEEAAMHGNLKPGRYAMLTVMDTGKGIAPEVMDRIFDPFFTTKGVNEGTGMGLSVVHGIVSHHAGAVTVYSKPDKGATFHVLLPLVTPKKTRTGNDDTAESIPKGSGSILIVDDDASLLEMEAEMLQRLGYRVTAFAAPLEALEYYREHLKDVDLVITDQTMPKMTGARLAKELMQIASDVRIILCTGYSEVLSEKEARAIGIGAFLMKPVNMGKLAKTVRRMLKGKEG